jgi:hypothetical protein
MDSTVNRTVVITVLRRFGVGVSLESDGKVLLARQGRIEATIMPDWVGKRMLHYLARRYEIPIHFFWHPEMMDNQSQSMALRPD